MNKRKLLKRSIGVILIYILGVGLGYFMPPERDLIKALWMFPAAVGIAVGIAGILVLLLRLFALLFFED